LFFGQPNTFAPTTAPKGQEILACRNAAGQRTTKNIAALKGQWNERRDVGAKHFSPRQLEKHGRLFAGNQKIPFLAKKNTRKGIFVKLTAE
jgi:hypothetical protein